MREYDWIVIDGPISTLEQDGKRHGRIEPIRALSASFCRMTTKWEYAVGGLPVEGANLSQVDVLNDWGDGNWELVTTVLSPEGGGTYLYYFKRQRLA